MGRAGGGVVTGRPHHLVHRGSVEASGFVLDADLLGVEVVQRRVLSRWRPGTRVLQQGPTTLLLLREPARVRRIDAPGEPLVPDEELLTAAPIAAEDAATASAGVVARPRGGVWEIVPRASFEPVDPASWIDVDRFQTAALTALGGAPRAAVLAPPEPDASARAVFDEVPELDPDAAAAIAEFVDPEASRGAKPAGGGGGLGAALGSLAAPFVSLLDRLFGSRGGEAGQAGSKYLPAPRERGPTWWDRLRERMKARVAQSQLGRLFGARQGKYLADLFDRLEAGDWEAALRRAIPLGGGRWRRQGAVPRRAQRAC
ncbi:MAG: hypothetical protein GY898_32145 [Proteobacteria bacterium]|nr:hypothetical protein [Pseudomonadota bacterium]